MKQGIGAPIPSSSSSQVQAQPNEMMMGMLSQLLDRFAPQAPHTHYMDQNVSKRPASLDHRSANHQGQLYQENLTLEQTHQGSAQPFPLPLANTSASQACRDVAMGQSLWCSPIVLLLCGITSHCNPLSTVLFHGFSYWLALVLARQMPVEQIIWPNMRLKLLKLCPRQKQKPKPRPRAKLVVPLKPSPSPKQKLKPKAKLLPTRKC